MAQWYVSPGKSQNGQICQMMGEQSSRNQRTFELERAHAIRIRLRVVVFEAGLDYKTESIRRRYSASERLKGRTEILGEVFGQAPLSIVFNRDCGRRDTASARRVKAGYRSTDAEVPKAVPQAGTGLELFP